LDLDLGNQAQAIEDFTKVVELCDTATYCQEAQLQLDELK
jgi:regulator of sirC expression with transglutaminase-like and TPR domain